MTSKEVFSQFVPPEAVNYCNKLYEKLGFEFKIKKARQTKLGDYRYNYYKQIHTITINNDLNPYSFLITYLHEVAHLITFKQYGNKVQPHGKEWKESFKEVSLPVLTEEVFEKPTLKILKDYFKNPKASSCADPDLYLIFRKYDSNTEKVLLSEIQLEEEFFFNKKLFKRGNKKRTRFVCEEVFSGKKYLIPILAEVLRKN